MNRRRFIAAIGGLAAFAHFPAEAQEMPSEDMMRRRLEAAPPGGPIRPQDRVTINEFKRRPDLRRMAPSIDIQTINFTTGSAEIPPSEYRKVRMIARALEAVAQRRRFARFLIEGHTDAVGTAQANQFLSEARAASLKHVLVREFAIHPRVLETVGYGETYLLVDTTAPEWRNRRVTIRRIDEFLR